jgi:hypothetical protein
VAIATTAVLVVVPVGPDSVDQVQALYLTTASYPVLRRLG